MQIAKNDIECTSIGKSNEKRADIYLGDEWDTVYIIFLVLKGVLNHYK